MTTNPYAYYDDEPLPMNTRPLSVSTGGEEEPDMEPRGPLELKGHFIALFKPAVRTYRINIERDSFECRLPNGEYLQLSRAEARKRVSVRGNEIDIVLPWAKSYCFRCKRHKNIGLTLARLKVWLQPSLTDPEEAYNAVAEQLKKSFLGTGFMIFLVLFLSWMVFMAYWDYPYWKFNRPGVLLYPAMLSLGVCLIRFVCMILFSAFLAFRLFGLVNIRLLRTATLLALVFPVYCWITILVPGFRIDNWQPPYTILEIYFPIWLPFVLYGIYHRYRRSEKQLQRDNGLI